MPIGPTPKKNLEDGNEAFDSIHSELRYDKSPAIGPTLLEPNPLRRLSISPFSQYGQDTLRDPRGISPAPRYPSRPSGFQSWCTTKWQRNKGPILVFLSQLFGAVMNLFARLLETEDDGMHPMQVLFARMSGTLLMSSIYMWWRSIPAAPLGPKEVRWLLVIRGLSGFFGIYGMWYSVMYLPLADATVISFLAPNLTGYLCHVFIHHPYTRKEQLASFVALGGVVLITRPLSLFSGAADPSASTKDGWGLENIPTASERLSAVFTALLGVLGASGALTTLRWIGTRAHPLISMTYFSTWSTIIATTTLSLAPLLDYNQPDLKFAPPHFARQWIMLLAIAICGFVMQFMLAAGLAIEKSNRATLMLYTHMLFAAGFDRWIFGHHMSWMSLSGCGLILGSALWIALAKKQGQGDDDIEARGVTAVEAFEILENIDDDEDAVVLQRLRAT